MNGLAHERSRVSAALMFALLVCVLLLLAASSFAQQSDAASQPRAFPKEMRGYKLKRAKVEIKKSKDERGANQSSNAMRDPDALIEFGEPHIASTSLFNITIEVPIRIAAVKQGGTADFLSFEDVTVNGVPVKVEDYMHSFKLPNDQPVTLPDPIRLQIGTDRAMAFASGQAQETWPVKGRVYIFGHFKKSLFTFKRVVPVELSLSLPNPLKSLQSGQLNKKQN
ncbi:MAG: hypothetical protein WBP93_07630 [Pyrinomonadaceae bacterium]